MAVLLLLGAFGASSQTAPGTRAASDRILDLNRRVHAQPDAAGLRALLEERARLLAESIERDPRSAVGYALPAGLRRDLARQVPGAASLLEETGEWTGPLVTIVEDDFERGRSRVERVIHLQGRAIGVFWPDPPSAGCSPSATVRGLRLGNRIAVASGEVAPQAAGDCSTTGDQKTLVLLASYPSTPLPSGFTTSSVYDTFFGPAPSVSDFWREVSYGRTTASGSVAGPFTLDADYSCSQTAAILQAAIAVADSTVDFTAFQRIFLIVPNTGSCSSYGTIGCSSRQSPSKGTFTASVSWIATSPTALRAISSHEGGHNFGLHHARSLDYDTIPLGPPGTPGTLGEYGDRFSTMGANQGHFAAPHKNLLGWLPQGTNWLQIASGGTYTLAPLSQASASLQALRIRRGSAANQWLWVEYRQPVGSYDSALNSGAFAGAVIHFEDPGQPSSATYTDLLHFKPTHAPNNFNNAPLNAGSAWSDPYSDLTLVIGSATPSGLTVTASYDSPCATLSPLSRTHGPLAETGQIGVSAPPGCAWTATAAASWITLTGGQSGNGSGTVSYSVAPNPDSSVRTAIVSIARQSFTISQNPLPQAVSVSPASGTGASQTFAFLFTDSFAYANLTSAEVNINASQSPAGSCYIRWEAAGSLLYLRNDAGDAWLGPAPVGSGAALQNAQCALAPGGSSVSGSGVNLTLNLALAFKAAFAGAKNVYMQTQSAAAATGWQQRGAWTVNTAPATIAVSPASGSGVAQVFTFTFANVDANTWVYVVFGPAANTANACALLHRAGSTALYLYNDAGTSTAWTGIGSGPSVENSQCILNGGGSSSVLTGSELTLTAAITFKPAFAGQQNVYISGSSQLYTPYQLRGTWTAVAGPAVVSVTPGSGTGASQSFTGVFSDPAAYGNLTAADIRVGGTANGCWVRYTPAANSLALRNDADSAWLAPVVPGSGAVSSNSQCILAGSGSSAAGSGATLTVVLALSFKPAFAGARTLSAQTGNASLSPAWQAWGTWTVNAAPAMIGVAPGSASGNSQVFTFSFGNVTNTTWLYVVFGTSSTFANSCSLAFYPQHSGFFLANDGGTLNYTAFNSSTPARNSQCSINPAASSIVLSGTDATVTIAASFEPAYAGLKNIYMSGNSTLYTPYLVRGTYLVTVGPAPSLSISKTHAGNFTLGQANATYTVTVSNQAGSAPTSGTVTVAENVPTGLTLVSMAGTGWTCPPGAAACTRGDPLAAGAAYPPLTVTVNVAANATSPQVNSVTASGGGSSSATAIDSTVIVSTNPVPAIASLSPASAYFGGPAFTLVVNGSGFVQGAEVRWNGIARVTTYLSPSQVQASIPASDIAAGGTATVTVFNPAPGGGASNAVAFSFTQAAKASLTSPAPGSTLPSTVTFQWTAGFGVAAYQLSLSRVSGGAELYNQYLGAAQSAVVTGLACDGLATYARLWSLIAGAWQFNDYTYTACAASKGAIASPAPGSTLTSSSVTFQWAAASGVAAYQLSVSSVPGGAELFNHYVGAALSAAATGLPADGRTLYVRLWSLIQGAWQFNDYSYTAASSPAAMTSPTPGSTFGSSTVTFQWTAGIGVAAYQLSISRAPGQAELYNQYLGGARTATATGLPCDGSTLYVRLWSLMSGAWQHNNYAYQACSATRAAMISPTPSSTLGSATQLFQWTAGSGVAAYQLSVSRVSGGAELFNQYLGSALSATATGLPCNGSTVYVRLWSLIGGAWQWNDYAYTACAGTKGALASPAPGSVLASGTQVFQWSPGAGVAAYQLSISSVFGQAELFNQYVGSALSATATGLPVNGRTLYVRLWSLIAGAWQYADYTYTAASLAAVMISPAQGTQLGSSTVTFQWTAGTGVAAYQLSISRVPGQAEVYNQFLGSAQSATATGLPRGGVPLYVRLWSLMSGAWQLNDYVYTAAP